MAIRIAAVVAAAFLFVPAGEASSTVKLGATPAISLPHVEGIMLPRSDGPTFIILLFAEKKPENVVLVDADGHDDPSLNEWADRTKTVAVKLSFVQGDERNYGMNILKDGKDLGAGYHRSGGLFKNLTLDGDKISGTIQHEPPPSPLSGTFETTLTIISESKSVTGPAVANSPQGKVLLAYAAAVRKGDFKTATKYSVHDEVTESKRTAKVMGKGYLKEMIEKTFKTAKEFEKLLSSPDASMVESGDKTKIELTDRMEMRSTINLVKVNGVWKVSLRF